MDNDKNIKEMESTKSKQMNLFELLEPQDINYANFVEFFDNLPLFIDDSRQRYWDYQNVKPSMSTEFKFTHEGVQRLFLVTLRPARVVQNTTGDEVLVYPSIQREQVVYDALRKLASSGSGGFFGEELGALFSLQALKKELKKFKRTFSIPQIKESLNVLRSAEIKVVSIDGAFEWQPSYLSNMVLTKREDILNGSGDSKCVALFDNLVSTSVKKLEFREYNYAIAQSTRNPIAKYLIKRMDRRYKQASLDKPYQIKMSTIFSAVHRKFDNKMSNNKRHMVAAFKEMIFKCRVKDYQEEVITNDNGKTVDYRYTIFPHQELINDVKRFHAKRSLTMRKNAVIPDHRKKREW